MENLIIKSITIVLVAAILSGAGCSINKQNKLAEMVKNKADPQKAACAVYFGTNSNEQIICNLIANKGN